MEAYVWSGTGLLPNHLETVRLTALENGRWLASCESDLGATDSMQFDAGAGAQLQVVHALRSRFGFAAPYAEETARRRFEPFEMAADWPW